MEWINTFSEIVPRRCVKSRIKQLCCGNELLDHVKADIPAPLTSTGVIAGEQIKQGIGDNRMNTNRD
jgi:hypothetical protein